MNEQLERRFWAKVEKAEGCWQWKGATLQGGYGKLWVDGRYHRAHRVSYELNIGPLPPGLHVCHACDNPGCVNPEHLWCGTQKDNLSDMTVKRRRATTRGTANGHSKLSEPQVRAIRKLLAAGKAHKDIAREFGVTKSAIGHISTGRNWRGVR